MLRLIGIEEKDFEYFRAASRAAFPLATDPDIRHFKNIVEEQLAKRTIPDSKQAEVEKIRTMLEEIIYKSDD